MTDVFKKSAKMVIYIQAARVKDKKKIPLKPVLKPLNVGTTREKQQTFAHHQIITKCLNGIDTVNEITDSSNDIKSDVRQGKARVKRK